MKNFLKNSWKEFCDYLDFCERLENGLNFEQQKELMKSGSLHRIRKTIREQRLDDEVVWMLFDWQQAREAKPEPPMLLWQNDVTGFYFEWHGFSNSIYLKMLELTVEKQIDLGVRRFLIQKFQQFALDFSQVDELSELLKAESQEVVTFMEKLPAHIKWLQNVLQQETFAREKIGKYPTDWYDMSCYDIVAGGETGARYAACMVNLSPENAIEELWRLRPKPEIQVKLFDLRSRGLQMRIKEFATLVQEVFEFYPNEEQNGFWIAAVYNQANAHSF